MLNKVSGKRVSQPLAVVGLGAAFILSPQAALAESFLLEEIIVTAQKREQNVQNVGGSVTAITGDQFKALGLDSVNDVASQAPNVNFSTPGGAGSNPSISIRGVGLSDFSDSNEGPVAVYVDEVYLGSLAGQTGSMFDLERVEVLRGPQGTLYGRNTTGGLMHFLTKKPTGVFEGYVDLTYGSWGTTKFEGAVGGPISDTVRGRISLSHHENDGTQRDRGTGVRGNVTDVTAYRGQLDIDINDETSLLLNAHGGKVDNKAQFYKNRGELDASGNPCSVGAVKARQCFDAFGFQDPDSDPRSVLTDGFGQTPVEIDTFGASAKLTWARDNWELVSITAYEEVDKLLKDTTYHGFLGGPGGPTSGGLLISPDFLADNSQFSQELRLTYSTDELTWMTGFFYFDDDKTGGQDIRPPGNTNPGGTPLTYIIDFDQETTALAMFGHVDWYFAENWMLEVGIRYSQEEKELVDFVDPGTLAPFPSFTFKDDIDTDNVSWNIGLDWQVNDDLLLFANIARGFKSGGWNSGGLVVTPEELAPFDDEILTTYELGLKTSFADDRVRVNATIFSYDYDDLQAFTQFESGGFPVSALQNAGSASVEGIEIELTLSPTDYLEAQFGLGYVDTETEDFLSFQGLDGGGNPVYEDLSGTHLTLAPDFTANGLVRVYFDMLGGEISGLVSFNHSDSYYFDSTNDPLQASGSFTIWNARVAWTGGPDDRYEIAAYVNNLTDEDYIVEGFKVAAGEQLIYNERRLSGITVGMNF